ncbi:MAG: hypothetical protein R6U43_00965 [Candidatus Krumholzibacteriales bacterium]
MASSEQVRKIDIILLGVYGIVAQTVFLREMLGLFRGTEFVVGIIIASWMIWVGAGSLLGGRIFGDLFVRKFRNFQLLIISTAFLLPATTITIRLGRGMLSGAPGEYPPLAGSILFCVLVMAPAAFGAGLLYNEASRWWKNRVGTISEGVSWVYILEAAGSLAGGIIFSLILLRYLTQFEISLLIFLLVALIVSRPLRKGKRKAAAAVALLGAIFFAGRILDDISIERLFPGYRVIDFESSEYGEIAVVEREGGISCYSGGSRLFTIPGRDRAEEMIHIPLLSHDNPGRVLVVGGGLKEELNEIARHPSVREADFVQLDGELIEILREYYIGGGTGRIDTELIIGDGRRFVKRSGKKYDVIIVNAPDPVNIEINRYYTIEFFRLAARVLEPGGILAVNHSSSENFISVQQGRALKSLEKTLLGIFDRVTVLPGSNLYFIAGERKIKLADIFAALSGRELGTEYINENYLPYRLNRERVDFTLSGMKKGAGVKVNRDLMPAMTSYELFLEFHRSGYSPPQFIIDIFRGRNSWVFLLACLLIIVIFAFPGRKTAAKLDIWTVGLTGFLFQISILLTYQAFSGYLYEGIIILTASFMAGISAGTLYSQLREKQLWKNGRLIHAALMALAVAHFVWVRRVTGAGAGIAAGTAGFISFSLLGGFLTGMFYRAVVSTVLETAVGEQPAVFYAWDMFGACLGSILGGVLLFPVFGINGAVAAILFLHLAGLSLLTGKWQTG